MIVWVKVIEFSFMPKIIRILSKDYVPWRYFVNFKLWIYQNLCFDWLVICIVKNFIRTTLKVILSIFYFFCIPRFRIFKKKKHQWKAYLFCFQNMYKSFFYLFLLMLMTGFVARGDHIYIFLAHVFCSLYISQKTDLQIQIKLYKNWVCLLFYLNHIRCLG